MLAVGLLMNFVAVLFVIVCVVLILVVLIQKGRGGGLSAAFGGGMAGSLLGSKTGDFLTWVTIVLVAVFLLLAIVLAKFYRPSVPGRGDDTTIVSQPADSTSPAPTDATGMPAESDMAGQPGPTQPGPAMQPETTESGPTTPAEPNGAAG